MFGRMLLGLFVVIVLLGDIGGVGRGCYLVWCWVLICLCRGCVVLLVDYLVFVVFP